VTVTVTISVRCVEKPLQGQTASLGSCHWAHVMQDFDTVLNISFSLMLGVYGAVAALGYYYFGSSAHTLVTTDLARNSPFTGHYLLLPGLTVDKLVSLSILLNAYSTYPSLVLVMQVTHPHSQHLIQFVLV